MWDYNRIERLEAIAAAHRYQMKVAKRDHDKECDMCKYRKPKKNDWFVQNIDKRRALTRKAKLGGQAAKKFKGGAAASGKRRGGR